MKSRKITSFLAWLLFFVLAAMSIFSLVFALIIQPEANQSSIDLAGAILWGLLPIGFAFMATMILARQPRNAIGWLLMLPAISATDGFLRTYYGGLTSAPSDTYALFAFGYLFYTSSWLLLIFPVFFIMLLFPTGRPINPNWRWSVYVVLGILTYFFIAITFSESIASPNGGLSIPNPIGIIPARWEEQLLLLTYAIGLGSATIISVISIFVRYRRALAVERAQIKWLLFACGLFAGLYFPAIAANLLSETWDTSGFLNLLLPLAMMTMPAAIAIAVLRYRLWDIDVIIRRTLVYALMTAALALVFFGSVTLLQSLFQAVTGEQSPVSIVLSTLAIAALFNPLRIYTQNFIDRRFFRRKYDAQKTLARFVARARDETDIEQLSADLIEVLQETMQPENVSLWLKKTQRGHT